jgi:hypothetical protein
MTMGRVKQLAEELAYRLLDEDDLGANPGGEREWREYFNRACVLIEEQRRVVESGDVTQPHL